jgi:hypothetical protein
MKNRLLMGAAALAVLSALAHFNAKPLLAKVHALLVENIDEPGRSPYQSVGRPLGMINTNTCAVDFAPVPPNKRLVVEHLSGFTAVTGTTNTLLGSFSAPNLRGGPEIYFSAVSVGPQQWATSQQMTVYLEPGSVPRVAFSITVNGPTSCVAVGNLSGHLIDLTQ